MENKVERYPIVGTGQQLEHLKQADAAARLSSFASNVASLCHALALGADPGHLTLLIERTRDFLIVANELDAGNPRTASYSELIPFQVWEGASPRHLAKSSDRVGHLLNAVDEMRLDKIDFKSEASYFRKLAESLTDHGIEAIKDAHDPLKV